MSRTGPLRGGLILAAATLAGVPATAEVVLTFGVEQRLEIGRNIDLSVPEGGQTTSAVTRLSFGAVTRTPLDALEFSAAAALVVENSDDTGGTEFELSRPDLGLRYTREVPTALFAVGAVYRRDDVDAFDEDLSVSDLDGTRTDSSVDLRFETGRTAPLGFAFAGSLTQTTYQDTTDPELVDTETLRVGVEAQLRLSEVIQASARLGYEREEETAAPLSVTEARTAGLGLTYALANGAATADLSFRTEDAEGDRTTFILGRSYELPAGSLSARLGVSRGDVGGTDVVGGLSWTQELPRGLLEVGLERRIDFDDDAVEALEITRFAVSFTQELSPLATLGLGLSHEVSDAPSERIELSQFAATYTYALTEDWGLSSGLRYRVRHDADGRSDSPDLFVALSRSFEFRP